MRHPEERNLPVTNIRFDVHHPDVIDELRSDPGIVDVDAHDLAIHQAPVGNAGLGSLPRRDLRVGRCSLPAAVPLASADQRTS